MDMLYLPYHHAPDLVSVNVKTKLQMSKLTCF
jgi:hypothetical protein